jgi:hypothetical protein
VKEAKWSDVVRVVSGGSFLEVRRLFVREKARGKRREGNGLFNFLNSPRLQWVVWLIGPSSMFVWWGYFELQTRMAAVSNLGRKA